MMTKLRLGELATALEGAGFEVVSVKEETYRDLKACGSFSSYGESKPPDMLDTTGIVALEIRAL
jgi:hypothetical protein